MYMRVYCYVLNRLKNRVDIFNYCIDSIVFEVPENTKKILTSFKQYEKYERSYISKNS